MPGPRGPRGNKMKGMPRGQIKKGTISRTLKYIFSHYAPQLIVVMVCIVFSSVASIISTIFMQKLIDDCITPGIASGISAVETQLISILITMGVIYALGIVASFLQNRIMAIVTQGVLRNFRDDMFVKMQSLPIRYFDTHAHGDIMSTYTNDTDAIREMVGRSLSSITQAVLSVTSIIVMMLTYSVWMTIAVVCIILAMSGLTKKIASANGKYMMAQQISLAREEGYIEEMMKGLKVVKVFCHEEESKEQFDQLNKQLYVDGCEANRYGNILAPILHNAGNIMYVVLAIVGGVLIALNVPNICLRGIAPITVGIIVSFLSMSRQLTQTVQQLSMQVSTIAMGMAGASRIFDLIDEEPEEDNGTVTLVNAKVVDGTITESDTPTGKWAWKSTVNGDTTYTMLKGDIRLKDVDFGYNQDKQVLYDITLYAKPGQKIAFVGATGAGKTTITNLINRFYDIGDGTITYDGIDISNIKKDNLRKSLGIVLQDVNLFSGTVMDNIRYGRLDATDEECIEAAKLANADDYIRRLPDGYNTYLTSNGAGLSQGQRQLLSIARVAVANPPVMILDEATSSIDTRTEKLVQEGMDNLMKGRTVFVIAHRLSTVRNSDAIMVLDHGKIIERGTHEQLLEEKGTYYQLYTGVFELE